MLRRVSFGSLLVSRIQICGVERRKVSFPPFFPMYVRPPPHRFAICGAACMPVSTVVTVLAAALLALCDPSISQPLQTRNTRSAYGVRCTRRRDWFVACTCANASPDRGAEGRCKSERAVRGLFAFTFSHASHASGMCIFNFLCTQTLLH